MIVYLYHKDHGVHVAYSDDEVTRCKLNGWVEKKPEVEKKTLHLPKRKDKDHV